MRSRRLTTLCVAFAVWSADAAAADISSNPDQARLLTEDIDHFWKAYDEGVAQANLTDALQDLYFQPASPGLRDFIELRIGSAEELASVVEGLPGTFAAMRESTSRVAEMEPAIRASFYALAYLYPHAVFPDVTFVIGRLSSGGTTSEHGLLIGTEMYGLTGETPRDELNDWLRAVMKPVDAIPHIVAHELIHFQQLDTSNPDLLMMCFREGSADFVAELISGSHINAHVHEWALPREHDIWQEFQKVMRGKEMDGWLYGGQPEEWPADVGYFIGYRIAQAYYRQAPDKRAAVADILRCEDAHAFLQSSGYAP